MGHSFAGATILPSTSSALRIKELVFVDSLYSAWLMVSASTSTYTFVHHSFTKPGLPCFCGPLFWAFCSEELRIRPPPCSPEPSSSLPCFLLCHPRADPFLSPVSQLVCHPLKTSQTVLSQETSAAVFSVFLQVIWIGPSGTDGGSLVTGCPLVSQCP